MKRHTILILTVALLTLSSCLKSVREEENTTPEVFQDQSIIEDISSYSKRGYSSLTDKLYNELLEKNTELKEIEEEFRILTKNSYNIEISDFLSNNSKYYNELKPYISIEDSIVNMNSYVAMIHDSTLREKILAEVYKSEENYKKKVVKLNSLQKRLDKKIIEMRDYRTAMKISLTLNSIEKYQDNFKQDTASIKELIKRHNNLTNTMKTKIENK
ncbi:MAG: hypothetical protein K8R54_01205 [Bacteroidales bacterium]|nr:hypothetical protein [Bacteroidales bacterium]